MGASETGLGGRRRPAGAMKGFQQRGDSVLFSLQGGLLRVAVLSGNCLRITFNADHRLTDARSAAVVGAPSFRAQTVSAGLTASAGLAAEEAGDVVRLRTEELTVEVTKGDAKIRIADSEGRIVSEDADDGLTLSRRTVRCTKAVERDAHFYGLGEKTGFLDKRGRKYVMWNTDDPVHTPTKDPLYKSIPLLLTFNGKWATGTFVDYPGRIWFDLGAHSEDRYSFEVDNRELDYYFIYGPDLKRVIGSYTELTGRICLPPLWALGYQQSRWGYYPEAVVQELADAFREKDIPCDVIYLDIDYMDGYRVFTWDEERFPDPERMLAELRAKGFRVVTIVNPGVKKDPDYQVYVDGVRRDVFCRWLTGEVYHGSVWPGESAFPDFTKEETRRWWAENHRALLGKGVAGIWNDMNEPSDFSRPVHEKMQATVPDEVIADNEGNPCTFRHVHNAYALQMCRSTHEAFLQLKPDERPFVVTRAAYAGIQRYAAVWTGDNCSWWEHLAMSLPLCMNIGLSGVPFVGGDVGGFGENATPELFARWMQVGAFTPFFRAHSTRDTRPHEPWAWGPEVEEICRKYIKLRYSLLPYLYNEFYKASQTGLPVMRPLVLDYPDDERTHNLNTEYLWGESFLIAPVTQPDTIKRCVYLPEGTWFDYWTDREYEGRQDHLVDAPLEILPIFVKAGSIVPSIPAANHVGEARAEVLTLDVYVHRGSEIRYTLYEDDGISHKHRDGEYNLTQFDCAASQREIVFRITPVISGYRAGRRKGYHVRFHGGAPTASEVDIDAPDDGRPATVVVDLDERGGV